MDRFQQLLYDLGQIIDLPLYADQNQRCRLNINEDLDIQLEYDSSKERILFASFCCEVPPGKFRENVLKEALKANGVFPRIGSYGFSEQKNKLALFEYISVQHLSSEKFGDLLAQFIDRAQRTKKAVETGNLLLFHEVTSQYDRNSFIL
jgi:hypothetical protein